MVVDRVSKTAPVLVVLEPCSQGHRLRYVANIAEEFFAHSPDGRLILVTNNETPDSDEFREHLNFLTGKIELVTCSDGPAGILKYALTINSGSQLNLSIPDGENFVLPILRNIALVSKADTHIALLMMRTEKLSAHPIRLIRQIFKRMSVRFLSSRSGLDVFFLSDAFGVVRERNGYKALTPLSDPAPPISRHGSSVYIDGWGKHGPTVGIIGRITDRKNPDLLLRFAAANPGIDVVLAGKVDCILDPIMVTLRNVTVIDRMLTDAEMEHVAAMVDVLFLIYTNDAPSGILATAAQFRTPVVVRRGTWLAEIVDELGTGIASDATVSALESAVSTILSTPDRYIANCDASGGLLSSVEFGQRMAGVHLYPKGEVNR